MSYKTAITAVLLFFTVIIVAMWAYLSPSSSTRVVHVNHFEPPGLRERKSSPTPKAELTHREAPRPADSTQAESTGKLAVRERPKSRQAPAPQVKQSARIAHAGERNVRPHFTPARKSPSLRSQAARWLNVVDEWSVHLRNELAQNVPLHILAGWNDLHYGDWESAVKRFDVALAREPGQITALNCKAEALVVGRKYQDAAQAYEQLLQRYPNDINARFNLAVILCRILETGRAAEQLREIIRQQPRHAKALYNLATLAQRDGRLAEARDSWIAFTRLSPGVSGGWFNLGLVHMDLYQPQEAAECFSQVILTDSNHSDGYVNMALACEAMEEFGPALGTLELAAELFPCDGTVLSALISLHRRMARTDRFDRTEHTQRAAALERLLEFSDEPAIELSTFATVNDDANTYEE